MAREAQKRGRGGKSHPARETAIVPQSNPAHLSRQDAQVAAFVYGVETPLAAVPTTGTATYYTALQGVGLHADTMTTLVGGGELRIDFAAGALQGEGTLAEHDLDGNALGEQAWYGAGSISTSTRAFRGGFAVIPTFASPAGQLSNGTLDGLFFGPGAEELGGSWTYTDPTTGTVYTGFILGKDGRLLPGSDTLRALFASVDLAETGWQWDGWRNLPAGDIQLTDFINEVAHGRVRYDAGIGAIVLEPFGPIPGTALTASNRLAAESGATYDVYASTEQLSGGQEHRFRVEMLRPAEDNPLIALTYTSFLRYAIDADRIASQQDYWEGILAFGLETPEESIPTTGTASYNGIVVGQSAQMLDGSGNTLGPLEISGSASLLFDFGAATLGGYLDMIAATRDGTASYDLGRYAFTDGTVVPGHGFHASFDRFAGTGSGLFGRFTGPAAEELFGQWSSAMTNPFGGSDARIWGVVVAKAE